MSRRKRMLADLDDQIRDHIERETDDNIARGMSPDEARNVALRKFGNVSRVKEDAREIWTVLWLERLAQDVRFALRMLRKNPGFAAVAILTLALGIGANTAIFSVTYGILLKPLPYPHSDRIMQIWGTSAYGPRKGVYLSARDFDGINQRQHSFAQVAAYLENGCCTVFAHGGPESIPGSRVSGNFFSVLGAQPLLGRPILPADDESGHEQVTVITYELWQQFFGGDPQIIGKQVLMQGGSSPGIPARSFTIVGVMPPLFPFPNLGKIFIPDADWAHEIQRIGIARLKDGVSISQANAELQSIAASLQAEYPQTDKNLSLSVAALRDRITQDHSAGILILLGAVGFVLVLACINLGNLLIARCWFRQGEISVRAALGATRGRIVRQLLTESVLLALSGGALGLLVANWSVALLRAIAPPGTPRLNEVSLDWHVFAYTLAISLLSGVAFGLAPALMIARSGPAAGIKEMRPSSYGTALSRRPKALRAVLIASEIALAFLLVTGATLVARSFLRLSNVDMGFRRDHVLTTFVLFSRDICFNSFSCRNARDEVLQNVATLPGAQTVAFAEWRPLSSIFTTTLQIDSRSDVPTAQDQMITPLYFDALGITFLKGRAFSDSDNASSLPVAIVNEAFAKAYLEGNPIGRRIAPEKDKAGNPIWREVVGEVADTRDMRPSYAPLPALYRPYSQGLGGPLGGASLIVRTASDPLALLPAIRAKVWDVDKKAPVPGAASIDQVLSEQAATPRFQTLLLSAFGAIALLLSLIGVYGVTSYSLAQRTHEIGVRVALGAHPSDIVLLVLGEGLAIAFAGIAAGVLAAFGLTRYLSSLLFEIKPLDTATFVGVALALAATVLFAYYIPARRATRVDPVTALRSE